MTPTETLLALERLDLDADALRERRARLRERAQLEACAMALAALAEGREAACARRRELEAEERRLEGLELELGGRVREVEGTLYASGVRAPRELQALSQEMDVFQRRRAEVEEEGLAVLERMEAVDGELAAQETQRRALEAEVVELRASLAAAEAAIDAELARLAARRAAVEPELPTSYRDIYARLRARPRPGGRVTATFAGGRCEGCRVTLPISDATRMRNQPADVAIQCPRCHRLLLR